MEKATRSAIERATQRARRLLEQDFAAQLESAFDVLPSGMVAPAPGAHLTAREAKQRERVVAAIAHKRAAGMTAAEAVADFVRDAAFTTLNRFAALKMLESRGLVQECVSRGEQSSGYHEFCGMAPGVALLPDGAGYRLYVESLFDELSTEIKVLFDRRDPASVLWPRRAAFADLLNALNAPELAGVWTDDETIGWVYQYFNSGDERRRMREASQAPRNSRELAVRNQFFTPRYVVEFLVDNTLGRTWLEMHGRDSRLAEQCRYLVRTEDDEARTRPRKDPRDLRILDPACGSGHFLLYGFDLLLTIYEEAWAAEQAPPSEATGRTLAEDYRDLDELRRAAPALIVEHILHGVDIDPRAAQIAALALWLRAQRAWKDLGVPAAQRPRITRTHLVVAEPMPGDEELVEEFAARLEPPLMRDLFRKMVAEMRLAGELGTLLPVEQSLAEELTRAREQFVRQRHVPQAGFLPGMERTKPFQGALDLSGIDDDGFFHEAEARLLEALRVFAEGPQGASGGEGVRRRLFAGDAGQGIALIDLLRRRFDVVLMNPPFGQPTPSTRARIAVDYPRSRTDIGMVMLERCGSLLVPGGRLGAITNRVFVFNDSLEDFRRRFLLTRHSALRTFIDLGWGVMDGALVEAAAFTVLANGDSSAAVPFIRVLDERDKAAAVENYFSGTQGSRTFVFRRSLDEFVSLPGATLVYQLPPALLRSITSGISLAAQNGNAAQGLIPGDDFRYLRLAWEVPPEQIGVDKVWVYYAKGGEYSPYWDDFHLVVRWARSGQEIRAFCDENGELRSRPRAMTYYFREGATYPERTTSDFSPRVMPRDCIFSAAGQAVFCEETDQVAAYIAGAYSRAFKLVVDAFFGSGDSSVPGSAAVHYRCGLLKQLPAPIAKDGPSLEASRQLIRAGAQRFAFDETTRIFEGVGWLRLRGAPLQDLCLAEGTERLNQAVCMLEWHRQIEQSVCLEFGFGEDEEAALDTLVGPHPLAYPDRLSEAERQLVASLWRLPEQELVSAVVALSGARRQLTKLSYLAHRRLELVAHAVERSAKSVSQCVTEARLLEPGAERAAAFRLLQFLVGCAFGRWDAQKAWAADEGGCFDPFVALPAVPPPMRTGGGIPVLVDDRGHASDMVSALAHRWTELSSRSAADLGELTSGVLGRVQPADLDVEVRGVLGRSFFEYHLSAYSKSRRQAPIYWQLATPSASYSVWLYAHRVTRDTFFQLQNDIVGPKLLHEQQRLASLIERAGATPSAAVRKEIGAQESFVEELRAMLDEVKRVTPLWNPDLDDGIVLVMAPLWRLVPQHKAWQKELKGKWDELVAGTYDWAHLAMHLWPERVVPKCATDRSLAIAHGLEDEFWVEGADGKWKSRTTPTRAIEELVRERSSTAVKAALKSLLEAPALGAGSRRAGGGRRGARP